MVPGLGSQGWVVGGSVRSLQFAAGLRALSGSHLRRRRGSYRPERESVHAHTMGERALLGEQQA